MRNLIKLLNMADFDLCSPQAWGFTTLSESITLGSMAPMALCQLLLTYNVRTPPLIISQAVMCSSWFRSYFKQKLQRMHAMQVCLPQNTCRADVVFSS